MLHGVVCDEWWLRTGAAVKACWRFDYFYAKNVSRTVTFRTEAFAWQKGTGSGCGLF